MNPYVEMRCDLADDPRVQRVSLDVKRPVAHVVGALHRLWSLAYVRGDGRRDIVIPHYTREMFESDVEITGLVAALATVGWCAEREDGSLIMPRGRERFAMLQRDRVKQYEADRKRRQRHKGSVPSMSRDCPGHSRDMSPNVPVSQSQSAAAKRRLKQMPKPEPKPPEHAAAAPEAAPESSAATLAPAAFAAELMGEPGTPARLRFMSLKNTGMSQKNLARFLADPRVTLQFAVDIAKRAREGGKGGGWVANGIDEHLRRFGGSNASGGTP